MCLIFFSRGSVFFSIVVLFAHFTPTHARASFFLSIVYIANAVWLVVCVFFFLSVGRATLPLASVHALLLGADAAEHAFGRSSGHAEDAFAHRCLALLHGPSAAGTAGSTAGSSRAGRSVRTAADRAPPKSCALEFASPWACGRFLRCVRRLGQQAGHAAFFAGAAAARPQAAKLAQDAPEMETLL